MADLPSVVEDTLNRLQSLEGRASRALEEVNRSAGMPSEWQAKAEAQLREVTPRGDSLLQRLGAARQGLDTQAQALTAALSQSENQVRQWEQELQKAVQEDVQALGQLREELGKSRTGLAELEARIRKDVQTAHEKLKALLDEASQAMQQADASVTEGLLARVQAARSQANARSQAFRQGMAAAVTELTEKTAAADAALAELSTGLAAHVDAVVETGARAGLEAVETFEKKALATTERGAAEVQRSSEAMRAAAAHVKERADALAAAGKGFHESAAANVPKFGQVSRIPTELHGVLKKARVVN